MRFALVTGASSGIGAEYARQLAARGHNVVVVSNRADENACVAAEIVERYGVRALPLYADLTLNEAAADIYRWCGDNGIEVDILVSNAGTLMFSQLKNSSPEAIDRMVALHCSTPAKLCRLFSCDMCRRGSGRILLMSSMTAWMPYPTISIYGATKAFLKNFALSLWYEVRGCGVSVTTVFPGAVDTPLYNLDGRTRRRLRACGVMMSAESVAAKGLRAMFRGRRRCTPGLLNKIIVAVCRLLPDAALLPVLKLGPVRRILERV